MNQFTRQTDWENVRAILNKHLKNAAEELNISIKEVTNIGFSPISFHAKLECFVKDVSPTGETKSIEELEWNKNAHCLKQFGLLLEDFGKSFKMWNGESYTVVSIKPKSWKSPVIGKRTDGKLFKFSPQQIDFVRNRNKQPIIIPQTQFNISAKLSPQLMEKFSNLTCRLSPENLACDGECSQSQIQARHAEIMREWRTLEVEAGRKVTEEEIEKELFSSLKG